jgi:hypothetical protein
MPLGEPNKGHPSSGPMFGRRPEKPAQGQAVPRPEPIQKQGVPRYRPSLPCEQARLSIPPSILARADELVEYDVGSGAHAPLRPLGS